jgi:hypothetical protein
MSHLCVEAFTDKPNINDLIPAVVGLWFLKQEFFSP